MNLMKKGTLVLSALSVFALTACGSNGLSLAQAREFLKDANPEKAKKVLIENETISWDVSVTGEGMEADAEDPCKIGGAQLLLVAIAWLQEDAGQTEFQTLLMKEEFKSLNSSYTDDYKKEEEMRAYDYTTSFACKKYFINEVENYSNSYDHKYSIKDNLLHASFKIEVGLELPSLENPPVYVLDQEIVYKKDGYSDHWAITTKNLPVKISWEFTPQPGTTITAEADGVMSGTITGNYKYQSK